MDSKNNSPKWKTFEKLVAALHKVEQDGATVKWNEKINGRQFDVTVRFKSGLYEFLTVIECKDYGKPIKVEKIDALATKSRDAKADKAVMVSANGYQKGTKEVAEKHNITLLTLKTLKGTKQDLVNSLTPLLSVSFVRLSVIHPNYKYLAIPEESGIMRSLMRDIRIVGKDFDICPEDMVKQHQAEMFERATSSPQTYEIYFRVDAEVILPNTLERMKIKSIIVDYALIMESDLKQGFGYSDDPFLLEDVFEIKNELNEQAKFIDFSKVKLGIDTVLEIGKFYLNPNLQFSYYCEHIEDEKAKLCLIESYQNKGLLQATFTLRLEFSSQFIEITDEKEIERLKVLFKDYKISTSNKGN